MKRLADVVAQIGEAVAAAGFTDRAALLQQRDVDLRSEDVERQNAAKDELRRVVHGMGGLIDIYYGSPEETRRLSQLINVMWQAVKVKP